MSTIIIYIGTVYKPGLNQQTTMNDQPNHEQNSLFKQSKLTWHLQTEYDGKYRVT